MVKTRDRRIEQDAGDGFSGDHADALGILAEKLIIGRALLRPHGLMPGAEGRVIASSFARTADRRAVRRLYDRTLANGMRGCELRGFHHVDVQPRVSAAELGRTRPN